MRIIPMLVSSFAFVAITAVSAAVSAATPILSVPPARSTTPAVSKAQATLLLRAGTAQLSITLPAPAATELSRLKSASTTGPRMHPMPIGFGRDVPAAQRTIAMSSLQWQGTSEGGRAAQIVVTSPGASALRIALQMQATDPDVVVRLKGDGAQAKVMGPYAANEIAETTQKLGEWWSPVLEGSSTTIEIAVSASVDVAKATLTVSRVSHLTRAGAALAPRAAVKDPDIGESGSCEINWKCEAPTPALVNAASAVAKMLFTQEDGNSYTCTGTLVNDSSGTQTPYFFTANHCIDSEYAASTLNVYWFFDAVDCDNPTTPANFVLQSGGATVLGRSQAEDWVLVQLKQPPPAGTMFSAWNASPLSAIPVFGLHHPKGDLTKFSVGNLSGLVLVHAKPVNGLIDFQAVLAQVSWNRGILEPGSSGSGLLSLHAGGNYYELRGGAAGTLTTCDDPTQPSFYSRFDQMLPKMRDYLVPGTNSPNEAVVVEFYNKSLDHYFMTASPIEINDLDTGVFAGWERTGLRFLAYTSQVPGTSPVCRFYQAPGYGDSHFYSASPSECSVLVDNPKFPGWIFESSNVFYIALPNANTGACVAGTHPMWRFYHWTATNHRYTDDVIVRDRLRADSNWIPEGYGPDAVIMCAPDGV